MAEFNFPSNPTDGQLYPSGIVPPGVTQYKWNAAKGTWQIVPKSVQEVEGERPVVIKGTLQVPIVSMPPASTTQDGYMSAADKRKLEELTGGVQSITAGVGLGAPQTGDSITKTGTINLLPAQSTVIGGVRPGPTLAVEADGKIDAKLATSQFPGIVRPGEGLAVSADGTLTTTGGLIVLKDISPAFNGTQLVFTLQRLDGTVYIPTAANQLMIFVGGIIQIPGTSFGISGSQIVFSSAPPTSANFYGVAIT